MMAADGGLGYFTRHGPRTRACGRGESGRLPGSSPAVFVVGCSGRARHGRCASHERPSRRGSRRRVGRLRQTTLGVGAGGQREHGGWERRLRLAGWRRVVEQHGGGQAAGGGACARAAVQEEEPAEREGDIVLDLCDSD